MANQSDNLDHATDIEMAYRASAEKAARWKEPVPKDFDGENCFDCGEGIAPARLALEKFRCIICQELKERGSKLFRR